MHRLFIFAIFAGALFRPMVIAADGRPYITTKSPITLLSANDGETDIAWRKTPEGLVDYDIKTKDSFTVIRLGPDHPPICRTVYGTVPCTIIGTPTMAISADGRFGLIANHGLRPGELDRAVYPEGEPLDNEDLADSPETVNGSPYEDGWFLRIRPTGDTVELLDADEYDEMIAGG